jgi:hypothetical protein
MIFTEWKTNMIRFAIAEQAVELMALWQAIALNRKPKRPARDYMDLRFANEVVAELGQK